MKPAMRYKLDELRSDYRTVVGTPFWHFCCPILFRDEEVDLCRAHIVPGAFPNSDRRWTVQRKDVDNFYGRCFEADFIDLQYHQGPSAEEIIANPRLSRKLRPKILIGDQEIPYFATNGPVPAHFTDAVVGGASGVIRLGLKIDRSEADAVLGKGCQIVVEKDVRLAALVSLLKAAHLTLFEMLGYRYALSAGGMFLGRTVLGDFFLRNRARSKTDVQKDATSHFREFVNMVRPVSFSATVVQDTLSDRFLFVCEAETPWGFVVVIRTSDLFHAVLVPILEMPSVDRFVNFLRSKGGPIQARRCRFDGQSFQAATTPETLMWPEAGFP
jgi:hypothetical protein